MFTKLDDLLNPNKIIPHYDKRCSVNKVSPPISAEIHWTSNCNYDCVHCSYGSRRQSKNYLHHDVIDDLINDLIEINCKSVYFSGGGEPTMIKKWASYANELMNSDIEVALITNGVTVKEKHLEIARKMNYIAVSVYSTKEERYQKITGSKFFSQQFSLPNIIKNDKSSTIIGARCVLNEINYDELYEIYCAAIDSGFDYIIFIPAVDYESKGIVLEEKWLILVNEDINNNIDKFDHYRTNVKSLLKRNIYHYTSSNYIDYSVNISHKCESINIGSCVFFNYDGGVYLCQPDIENKEFEIGNLNNDRFINIWNSSRHVQIMERLNKRWERGHCKNCRSIAFNKAILAHQKYPVEINTIAKDCFL